MADPATRQTPAMQPPGAAAFAMIGSLAGGVTAGAALGYFLCEGDAGVAIGVLAFGATFAVGYGSWGAYVLARAQASIFGLLFQAFLRRKEKNALDRERWRAELGAMWEDALRKSFLFWLNALWIGALAAVAIAICARGQAPLSAAAVLYAAVIAYGIGLARLARAGYFIPPEG